MKSVMSHDAMSLSEFELIRKYFRNAFKDSADVKCGIGDDAAVVSVPAGMELALSMDTLVAGVHFPQNTTPEDIGYKALAVNLSDMAAMGAEPRWIMLALTLPENDPAWIEKFMAGFSVLAKKYSLSLIGGDLTCGPLAITIQIHGYLPEGQGLYRSGAKTGNLVYVSGTLGDAGLALGMFEQRWNWNIDEKHLPYLSSRLNRPEPRIELGMALRNITTSAIDVSDGLLADLNHILTESSKGAVIHMGKLPLPEAMQNFPVDQALEIALTSGDDYELCFTIPADRQKLVERKLKKYCRVSCIGEITGTSGIKWLKADGSMYFPKGSAYRHF